LGVFLVMELSLLLLKEIAALFIIIFFGFLLVRLNIIQPPQSRGFSIIVLYVLSPCMILTSMQIEFTPAKLTGLLLAVALAVLVHLLFIGFCKVMRPVVKNNSIEDASMIYTNCGSLIVPLVSKVLGPEALFYTLAYVIVLTILSWVHCQPSLTGTRPTAKKILLNVNLIAIYVGFILFVLNIKLPGVIDSAVRGCTAMIGPVCMLVIGIMVGSLNLKEAFTNKRVYLISAFRMLVFPFIILVLFKLLNLLPIHPEQYDIFLMVLMAGSGPTASLVTQFCAVANKDPGYASVLDMMTTLWCILTIPLMVFLYQL